MVERSRRSVGATLAAARAALAEGVAANLAGGTHHASAAAAAAIASSTTSPSRRASLQARGAALRIVVVDLDVHQGDGTASIFAGDPSVFTISLHGEKNFPFRKAASDLDVALPDGCGDADYLRALDPRCSTSGREHGARGRSAWPSTSPAPTRTKATGSAASSSAPRGLLARDRRVLAALGALDIPVALAMAGGYGHDIDVTVAIQAATIAAAIESWRGWRDRSPASRRGARFLRTRAQQSRPMTAPRFRSAAPTATARPINAAKLDRPQPLPRSRYRRFVPLTTRWLDNDAYGHLNNVVYSACSTPRSTAS